MTWRFFIKQSNGDGYVRTSWFWSALQADGSMTVSPTGFFTLEACEADARREGYAPDTDETEHQYLPTRLRW